MLSYLFATDSNQPMQEHQPGDDQIDFGYVTAIVGLAVAAVLAIVMFATSGQV